MIARPLPARTCHARYARVATWLAAALLGGCAGSDRATSATADLTPSAASASAATAHAPSDFALGITVFGGTGAAARVQAQTNAAKRPARYMLEPGRTLRAAAGPDLTPRFVPPVVRTLNEEQVAELYAIARNSGLLVPGHGATVATPVDYAPPAGRTGGTVLISYTSNGRQASLALPAAEAAAKPLVERLASLAWFESPAK